VITGVTPFGDTALIVEVDDVASAHRVAAVIDESRRSGRAPGCIAETVVGFRSVVVHLDPGEDPPELVARWLAGLPSGGAPPASEPPGRLSVEVPVSFDGPDLEAVATMAGASPAAVVERVCGAALRVAFLGFVPGFPYLVGLPSELASIPRRASPRASVPPGSVAIGGGFASIYPQATPGGWMLLGRTPMRLFDADRPPYALLSPGDTVRFSAGSPGGHDGPPSSPGRARLRAQGDRFVEVLDPGLLSLVEDDGRRAVAGIGVPRAGPADTEAMRLANRLVGNPDRAATIEVTAVGPRLRFTGDAHLGVVGSSIDGVEVRIDGHPVAAGAVSPVGNGQVVTVGRVLTGLRAYVAVSGGFETPPVVGSRSTDVLSGLGPGPLAAGDQLDLGPPSRPHGHLMQPLDPGSGRGPAVLRFVAGPHRLPTVDAGLLAAAPWTVGSESNRIGVRLTGRHRLPAARDAGIPSVGMVTGAIQVPPDGNPIILGPDHATVGGYPVIACVISADLSLVGQLRPGDTVTFTAVDLRTARDERLERERMLATRVRGWFPTAAGT
jgi:KipI family sensor histidine kinase inhibitor